VEKLTWRLLPYTVADGPTNMAADEALLQTATSGLATLRFYGWSQPTLSLGYFQKESVRHSEPLLAALPFVRRPTGGETLVHDHELTYAMVVPAGSEPHTVWPRRMHEIIVAALTALGIKARLFEAGNPTAAAGPLCFHHFTPGDVLVGSAKVVGSAQRRHRGALLQHGGVLLARSPRAPTLAGLLELTGLDVMPQDLQGAVVQSFETLLQAPLQAGTMSAEVHHVRQLESSKYRTAAWNCRR
jgi:lipoyl(octanoyl) transferase